MIIFKPYYKTNGGAALKLCSYYDIDGDKGFYAYEEIHHYISEGHEFVLGKAEKNKHKEYMEANFCLAKHLFAIIVSQQNRESKDVEFLNRIIREGGYTNYIKKLEAQL